MMATTTRKGTAMDERMKDAEVMEKALKALDIQQARSKRHNEYIKENFKRITVTIPRSWEGALNEVAKSSGESVNSFFKRILLEELQKRGVEVEDE